VRGELGQLASSIGLSVQWRSQDEARASCPEREFWQRTTDLAQSVLLSDLFATTADGSAATLTAVLQMVGDPAWLLLSTELSGTSFPSLTPAIHAASWYEREIFEMHGLEPVGHPAAAPLRLHDWPDDYPPMSGPQPGPGPVPRYPFDVIRPAVMGQGVFTLPLGPVRSGPQESAEFLFASGGEDIVMVSLRLGYKFRAIERLAQGRSADLALPLAERLAGLSAFANGLAFTRAVERAVGAAVSPAAEHTRTLLAEIERLHSHFGTIARLCEATGLLVAAAQYGLLKEEVLRIGGRLTGHRYLRGALRIGGVEAVPTATLRGDLRSLAADWSARSERLQRLLAETSIFVDRLETTAVLTPDYAAEHNLVGPVGRASGQDRDARRDHPYAAYGALRLTVPTALDGDAEARLQVLVAEVQQSLAIVDDLFDSWPAESGQTGPPALRAGSALGWAEAPGGETLHFVDLDETGAVRRWRARPPAVVNWHPFAHACGSGNNLTDYPVIEASFSLSHAEFDR
jgi:Ni,Fe-hydrogenase III large subunit/Ni,Fe-hydrogenase III component G